GTYTCNGLFPGTESMRRCSCSGAQPTPLDAPPYAADFSHTYGTFCEEPIQVRLYECSAGSLGVGAALSFRGSGRSALTSARPCGEGARRSDLPNQRQPAWR